MNKKRTRQIWSIKNELLQKSQESALCAVQLYNNPTVTFKSEGFIVLMIIAWTYLMHAYYRSSGVDYRYFNHNGNRRRFIKTKHNSDKFWELETCLKHDACPIDENTKNNLLFLINLRHEIEHRMTHRIDDLLSAKLQACCLNYNQVIKNLFNKDLGSYQPISLQFFAFSEEQVESLKGAAGVPKNIVNYISNFEAGLTADEINSSNYSYRIIYIRENVNREGQADKAYRFVNEGSEEEKAIHNILLKSRKRPTLTHGDLATKLKLNKTQLNNLLKNLDVKNNQNLCEKTIVGKKTPTWKYSNECLSILEKWLAKNNIEYLKGRQ